MGDWTHLLLRVKLMPQANCLFNELFIAPPHAACTPHVHLRTPNLQPASSKLKSSPPLPELSGASALHCLSPTLNPSSRSSCRYEQFARDYELLRELIETFWMTFVSFEPHGSHIVTHCSQWDHMFLTTLVEWEVFLIFSQFVRHRLLYMRPKSFVPRLLK